MREVLGRNSQYIVLSGMSSAQADGMPHVVTSDADQSAQLERNVSRNSKLFYASQRCPNNGMQPVEDICGIMRAGVKLWHLKGKRINSVI